MKSQAKLRVVGGERSSLPPKRKPLTQAQIIEAYMQRQLGRYGHEKYAPSPILFRKCDVKVGTILKNISRHEQGTFWRVTRIITSIEAIHVTRTVETVVSLSDLVEIVKVDGTNQPHRVRFGTLSYSAAWLLAGDEYAAAAE